MPLIGDPILMPGSAESDIDENFNWSARRTYQCFFTPGTDESTARKSLGPDLQMLKVHPNDPSLLITNIRVKEDGGLRTAQSEPASSIIYIADITYSAWTPLLAAQTGNPIQAPYNYRWQCERGEVVADKDIEGNYLKNSVGDPPNPPVMKNKTSIQFIVIANLANPDFFNIKFNYVDHTNSVQWGPFPPRSVLLGPVNMPDRSYSQVTQQLYYRVEFTFDVNPDLFDVVLANLGYRDINPETNELRNILIDGNPATDPVLIGSDNVALKAPVSDEDIIYNTYKIYHEVDFSGLGLDSVFTSDNFPGGGS